MIVYGSGIGDGNRHNHNDLPILLAGGGGVHSAAALPLPLCARVLSLALADDLEVTVRTVYRDIATLQARRVPIEGAPGIGLASQALFSCAAMLHRVGISHPDGPIGRNTVHSMQSGIFFGYVGLVDGIVRRMQKEIGAPAKVVATGGLAPLIAAHGKPSFIKIDVEGFEEEALAGLTQPVNALSFEFTTIQRDVAQLQDQVKQMQASQDQKIAALETLLKQALEESAKTGPLLTTLQQTLTERIGEHVNAIQSATTEAVSAIASSNAAVSPPRSATRSRKSSAGSARTASPF